MRTWFLVFSLGCAPHGPTTSSVDDRSDEPLSSTWEAPDTPRGTLQCASDLDADHYVHAVWVDLDTGHGEWSHVMPWSVRLLARDRPPGVRWAGPVRIDDDGSAITVFLLDGVVQLPSLDRLGSGQLLVDGGTVELVCWHDSLPDAVGQRPLPDLPGVLDDDCAAGRNALPLPFVRTTGVGRCADLTGAALNGEDYRYPMLLGYDLRGATLDEAQLFFADLVDVRLEGADLRDLEYGYAVIEGTVDDTSRLPDGCFVEAEQVECGR
jgi:hypothetical protein